MSNPSKILIVDDSMVNLAVLDEMLESLGFEVYLANNGERCLLTARQVEPELILLDVIMPGWDGYETCRRLKADAELKHIPVLFLSGLDDTKNKVLALEAGGVDYVSKPFQESELIARVNTHLELSHLRYSLEQEVKKKTSEIETLLEELRLSYQQAQEASVLKTQFLRNISHEFRTPMNIILGTTDELIEDTELDTEQHTMADDILSAGKRLMRILTNMLNFSQQFNNEFTHKIEDFNIYSLLQQMQDDYRPLIENKSLNFELKANEGLPDVVYGNKAYIHEVLVKLFNNAIKYTERGFVRIKLEWQMDAPTQENGAHQCYCLKFSVEDSGIGISKENQECLFQTFSQIDGSSTREYEGMGMGLALARVYVERLGGDIGVDSELGKGSCFWFKVAVDTHPPQSKEDTTADND